AEAAQALFTAITDDLAAVQPRERLDVRLDAEEREYLLFDWLRALLYDFDANHRLFSRFEVRVGENGLTGTAWGERLAPERHALDHEVKAITYHGLRVEQAPEGGEPCGTPLGEPSAPSRKGWLAEVIVDI